MALLILTSPGESVSVGGENVDVIGTSSPGDRIEVVGGSIRMDASFNGGGDTISLPGLPPDYVITFVGSRAILTGDDGLVVSIPLSPNQLELAFRGALEGDQDDSIYALRITGGNVVFGDQIVENGDRLQEAAASPAATAGHDAAADIFPAAPAAMLPDLPGAGDHGPDPSFARFGSADFQIA